MDFSQRWLLMMAISLLLLRINIRTLAILLGIGLPLVTLWLYMDAKYFSVKARNTSSKEVCVCPICKHSAAEVCLQERCSCCLITQDEKVVGHSSSPLQ
jgi:hypothetical protein